MGRNEANVLSNPQFIFLKKLSSKFRGYVGGFGSGKTYVGCLDLLLFAIAHPKIIQGYFGPSYSAIRDIFWPTLEEAALTLGLRVVVKRGDKEVFLYRGGVYIGAIICRSMDRPESIVGFKIARALVDEIDTLPVDKATRAWRMIIARMRLLMPGVVNGIGVTCTPEGFGFTYQHFKKNPTKSYSMVQASTYENERFLPPDYISSLYESYPSNLVDAYILGKFVNLTAGQVYYAFNRQTCSSSWVVRPKEKLHIGMDFNVNDMCAVVHIERDGITVAVDEFMGLRDTPDMCQAIKEKYPDHKIFVYPDSSGKGTSSKSASVSDISIIKKAKFVIRARNNNPRIKNRVASMNMQFEDGKYKVNIETCLEYAEALEQQPYNPSTGQPLKDGRLDNRVDGAGYFISYQHPIIKPSFTQRRVGGL